MARAAVARILQILLIQIMVLVLLRSLRVVNYGVLLGLRAESAIGSIEFRFGQSVFN